MKLTSARSLVLAATLSTILTLSVAYYWPIQEAYHPLNPGWNGCSKVGADQNATLLLSYEKPLPNGSSLLAIIGPSRDFSHNEAAQIRNFMEAGGTVLLADDFGTGNSLLEALNVSARFAEKPIADLYYYSRDPNFPVITDFSDSPVTANVTAILLNHPSFIEIKNSSDVTRLASSSAFSFIRLTEVNGPSPNETIDSYPVMASAKFNIGRLILISNPGLFVNEMIDLYDNMRLFQNILAMGNGSLFFDVAHLANAPLTNPRITLKNQIDSFRDFLLFSKTSFYIQSFLVALVLVLSLSRLLIRVVKSKRMEK